MKKDIVNIFIHRRDLRVNDNIALNKLIEAKPDIKTLHIFIFNPKQIEPTKNQYYNKNTIEFLIQCLRDLNIQLDDSLHVFYGEDTEVLSKLLSSLRITCISFNIDYTPFAMHRDNELIKWCESKGIDIIVGDDYHLFPFDGIKNNNNSPYEVFTPFYKKCIDMLPNILKVKDIDVKKHHLYRKKTLGGIIKNIDIYYGEKPNKLLALKGGRQPALDILRKILNGNFKNYAKTRDYPALNSTTHLSAYLKYGCISIREALDTITKKDKTTGNDLLRELIWREFYAHIAYHFPRVLQGQIVGANAAFKQKYDNLPWKYDEITWKAFISGKTGFPFVDAGIRQLITTGWCHNRARMVIANFAAKDLKFPPIRVERWFASNLIDYDPCSNSGGVQWAYGIGSDAQPYFRIFNPFTQSRKYDPNAVYIKNWVPELRKVSIETIHSWNSCEKKTECSNTKYPKPIVDHNLEAKSSIAMFHMHK